MTNAFANELEIIARIKGEVFDRKEDTGVNLFLVWGYPALCVLLTEFAALMLWNVNLCSWLWVVIHLVGVPLMMYYLRKDYARTGRRTLDENIAIKLWLFIGFACGFGGFATGFAGVYEQCYSMFEGQLVGMGCYLTGVISRFRPMRVCGIVGATLSFVCVFLQGSLWPYQLLLTAVIVVITLIVPGHMTRRYIRKRRVKDEE